MLSFKNSLSNSARISNKERASRAFSCEQYKHLGEEVLKFPVFYSNINILGIVWWIPIMHFAKHKMEYILRASFTGYGMVLER